MFHDRPIQQYLSFMVIPKMQHKVAKHSARDVGTVLSDHKTVSDRRQLKRSLTALAALTGDPEMQHKVAKHFARDVGTVLSDYKTVYDRSGRDYRWRSERKVCIL